MCINNFNFKPTPTYTYIHAVYFQFQANCNWNKKSDIRHKSYEREENEEVVKKSSVKVAFFLTSMRDTLVSWLLAINSF